MILDRVPAGKDVPNDVNVIIEIPANSSPTPFPPMYCDRNVMYEPS